MNIWDRISTASTWIARGCLLTLVALLPWSFGGVDAFSQSIICPILMIAFLAQGLGDLLNREAPFHVLWSAIPAAFLILLTWTQCVNIGPEWVASLNSTTSQLRQDLLPPENSAPLPVELQIAQNELRTDTISVYPPATRRETALLLTGIATLTLASHSFRDPLSIRVLSACLLFNAGLISYFGIVQLLSWNGRLFWVVPIEGTTPFGPFINRNAGGGFLVICLTTLIVLADRQSNRATILSSRMRYSGTDLINQWRPPQRFWHYGIALVGGLVLVGLLLSLSRGAWLGASVGVLVLVATIGWRNLRPSIVISVAASLLACFALLFWLSLSDQVQARIPVAANGRLRLGDRLDLWRDVLRMIPDFWQTGSGLGTFGLVQPIYQHRPMTIWFDQAENLFLQLLTEAGAGGLLLLVLTTFWVIWTIIELLIHPIQPSDKSIARMGLCAIASQIICASFDFGLRYPGNQLTLALIVGAVLGRATMIRSHYDRPWFRNMPRVILVVLQTIVWLIALSVSWQEIAWSGGVELEINRGDTTMLERPSSRPELDASIQSMEILISAHPDNGEGRVHLADLLVLSYRNAVLMQLEAELGSDTGLKRDDLWPYTSLSTLQQRAAEFERSGDHEHFDELRQHPAVKEFLVPAFRQAWLARECGPFLPRPHQLLAELSFLTGSASDNASDIERTLKLLPQNPDIRYWAGDLHLQAARIADCCQEWQKCLELTAKYDRKIFEQAFAAIPSEAILQELLPNSIPVIVRILDDPDMFELDQLRAPLGARLLSMLSPDQLKDKPPAETKYALAIAQDFTGNTSESIKTLRQALQHAPERITWRLRLARQLSEQGEKGQALREAELALRLSPKHLQARQLVEELLRSDAQ